MQLVTRPRTPADAGRISVLDQKALVVIWRLGGEERGPVQSVFVPHLEPRQHCLGDEVVKIFRHQLAFLHTGIGPNDYTELREFLMNE